MDIRQRLLVVFQAEAKEHLARIRSILGKEGEGTAGANLDEVFRRAHSLKGAARAVDLRVVEILAHPLETLFARVREGALKLNSSVMALVHQALDGIDESVAAQLSGKTQAEPTQLLHAIHALVDASAVAAAPTEKEPEPSVKEPPKSVSTPALPHIAPAVEVQAVPVVHSPATLAFNETETMRVSASIIERLHRSTGQLTTESLSQKLLTDKLLAVGQQVSEIARRMGSGASNVSINAATHG